MVLTVGSAPISPKPVSGQPPPDWWWEGLLSPGIRGVVRAFEMWCGLIPVAKSALS